jgi:hypothetical protein
MPEDDSTVRLDLWWQGLTDDQHAQFRDLETGDPSPREHLTPMPERVSWLVRTWRANKVLPTV